MSSDPERFLTPSEAAELFGVDRKTLARWEQEGKLRAIRTAGGHRRYRMADLTAAREARTSAAPAPTVGPRAAPPAEAVDRPSQRRRALEALHAADVSGSSPEVDGLPPFARALIEGVGANRAQLDELIGGAAEHWTLDRMPVVDRNILRIAVYELLHTDTPTGAVVDQAVGLAKLLSTEGSGRFVNGILARLAREHRG